MKKIAAVAAKEFRQVSRDPLTLAMLLGIPAMMLLLYGFALNFDVRHVGLAVEDRDKSASSRALVASFVESTYFDVVRDLPPGADAARLFERREAKGVLVIPEGYAREIAAGRRGTVQLLLDGADATTASTVLGYASAIAAEAGAHLPAPIDWRPRVWYNPDLESTQFLVPGLVGFILMLTAVVSMAISVVREKERGTMEQLRVTSLRPAELVVGKVLPYLLISLAAAVVIFATARVLFDVSVRGPYLDLFLATLVYLLGALGWGLLVSSVSSNQAMAFQLGTISSMLPAIFLSGFIFPIRSMPLVLQAITYVVPARYYLIIVRGIVLKGQGLSAYLEDLLYLLLFGAIVLGLAWLRLVKREG